MNSDQKYSEFVKQQERMMKKRRHQAQPEVRKQKAATDKLRLGKMKTNPEENKKKYEKQLYKIKQFDEKYEETKKNRTWPHCFDTEYGYLFKKNPQSKRKYEDLLENGYVVCKANDRDASILEAAFQLYDYGDSNKRKGNFPRNLGKKEYIFDTENTSNPNHSKR